MVQNTNKVVQHLTRKQLEGKIIEKACSDAAFRASLLEHPKKAIATAFGIEGLEKMNIDIQVIQETANKLYLVLPTASVSNGELNDEDLEAVAGGSGVVLTEQTIPVILVVDPPPPIVVVAPPPVPVVQTVQPQVQVTTTSNPQTPSSNPTNFVTSVRIVDHTYDDQPAKSGK